MANCTFPASQIRTTLCMSAAYGYWIPGNARDALLAIFLRGHKDAVIEALRALV